MELSGYVDDHISTRFPLLDKYSAKFLRVVSKKFVRTAVRSRPLGRSNVRELSFLHPTSD